MAESLGDRGEAEEEAKKSLKAVKCLFSIAFDSSSDVLKTQMIGIYYQDLWIYT